ncbi:MAG: hypothetical protein AB8B85_21120 [Paracoccaceae bacterium]
MTKSPAILVVPRSRIADAARVAASVVFGLPFVVLGWEAPAMLVIAVFLLGYAISLSLKMLDNRPALIADDRTLTLFRFPGASVQYSWQQITEIAFLKMRGKRVLFVKAEGDRAFSELANFDFQGQGYAVAARLREIWEQRR